jgi:hypothetical protein
VVYEYDNMMFSAGVISQDDQCYLSVWYAGRQAHTTVLLHCSPAQIILFDSNYCTIIAFDYRGRGGPSELHTSPGSLAPR